MYIRVWSVLFCLFVFVGANEGEEQNLSIEALQNEIKELKQSIQHIESVQKEHESYMEDIESYTEDTETLVLEDKLKFGLGFKTNLDNFTKKYASGRVVRNNNIWSNKLMLNAKANITKSMKFYARFSMYKYWGSSYVHPYSSYDNMQARVPSDSSIYVERAYLDWFFNQEGLIPFALTLGRQPSADGPSHQFKDNTTRKATYSALLYDGTADGAVLTLNMSKLLNYKKTYLRFGYAKGFGYSETSKDVGNAYIGANNNDLKDTNIYGLFFDTVLPSIQSSLVQFSYSKMKDVIANPLDANSSANKNIGDVDMYGVMIEITDLDGSGLDLFAHYGYVHTAPNANTYLEYGGLLNSAGKSESKSGDAVWIGGRYGMGPKKEYKVGFEYNHGSKNWVSLTQGSFDVYNKLATRGNAYEAYFMYVINRYSNIRLGYVDINYDYTKSGWFVGESVPIDHTDNPDAELKHLSSIYLKLNVLF